VTSQLEKGTLLGKSQGFSSRALLAQLGTVPTSPKTSQIRPPRNTKLFQELIALLHDSWDPAPANHSPSRSLIGRF
jgi:hypothetical protein